jgi:basic membrane protein A and related proteins
VAIRKRTIGVALALVAVLALAVATSVSAKSSKAQPDTIKVAVVTDIGGLNDKGFNALAAKGLADAKTQLGITGRVFISKSSADYIPNLSTAARQGYDLVIGNGFLMGDALAAVAKRFPKTDFAIIDFPWVALKGKPKNARGLLFRENEAGYLAGVAAATVAKGKTVSFVGGQAVPAVVAFRAGFIKGVNATKKGTKVLSGYSEEFVDPAPCKELAINQISQGSKVVFAAAGQCGLGALQAAKERKVWGEGVDSDQAFLGTHILTSATKKVNLAVFTTIQQVLNDAFKGSTDGVFTVKNGGVGFGKVSVKAPNRAALIKKLNLVSKRIAQGKIKNIPIK